MEVAGLAVWAKACLQPKLTDEQVPFPLSALVPGKRWNRAPSAYKTLLLGVLRPGGRIDLSIGAFVEETLSHKSIRVLNLEQHIGTVMGVDINISVVDAICGRKLHSQSRDIAGGFPYKFNLLI